MVSAACGDHGGIRRDAELRQEYGQVGAADTYPFESPRFARPIVIRGVGKHDDKVSLSKGHILCFFIQGCFAVYDKADQKMTSRGWPELMIGGVGAFSAKVQVHVASVKLGKYCFGHIESPVLLLLLL